MKVVASAFPTETVFGADGDALRAGMQAQSLSKILRKVTHPTVIAIDGRWGTGKSTFLRMWENDVKVHAQSFSIIHFDCFEDDYLDDPFVSLTSCIVEFADLHVPTNKVSKNLKTFAAKVLTQLPGVALKVGTAAALGLLPSGLSDLTKKLGEVALDDFSSNGEEEFEKLLASQLDRRAAAKELSLRLSDLRIELNQLNNRDASNPLVIVVDELDRCRPSFALKLLERIKHYMNVPGVHFVLGLNSVQMASSVKAAYGSDVDAEAYLRKFINLTISLREVSTKLSTDDLAVATNRFLDEFGLNDRRGVISACVSEFAVPLGATLRDLERILANLSVVANGNHPHYSYVDYMVPSLIALKILRPKLYEKARQGYLNYQEVAQAFDWPEFEVYSSDIVISLQLHAWLCAVKSKLRDGATFRVNDSLRPQVTVNYQPDSLKLAIRVVEDFNII